MKKTTLAAVGASLIALTALGAVAANAGDGWGRGMKGHGPMMGMMGPAGGPMQLFKDLDTDKDGRLTKAELDAGRAAKFAEANTDGQGGVTIAEFEPWFWAQHREMMVRAFQFLDRDGDGEVTEAELSTLSERAFERMDRNGDGVISADDRGRRGDRDGRGHGRHGWDRDDDDRGPRWGRGPAPAPESAPADAPDAPPAPPVETAPAQ